MKIIPLTALAGLALASIALAGCQTTIASTSRFYHPATTRTYPPKPEGFSIAVLDCAPKQKFEAIGHFAFTKSFSDDIADGPFEDGHDFMIAAVKYNARLAGADAVIMLDDSVACDSASSAPGSTSAKVGKRSKRGGAQNSPKSDNDTSGIPHGGSMVTRTVDAQMIVFGR